jgi:hypothetical protein
MTPIARIMMLVALAIALVGTYRYVSAQEHYFQAGRASVTPPTLTIQPSSVNVSAQKHVLGGTYINHGAFTLINGAPLSITAYTYTPIDTATTITCPGTTGSCLIVSEQWTQLSSNFGGQAATCLYVDGSPDVYCGNFDGEMFAGFSNTATSHQATVSHGTHTVQTYVVTTTNALANYFDYHYQVFKP